MTTRRRPDRPGGKAGGTHRPERAGGVKIIAGARSPERAGVKIIAGAWRGRLLATPAGMATRPTAGRLRQALFDMLWHAAWAGRAWMEGAQVLDVFAGSGALGLEALSRGAASAEFLETDPAALAALRANIATCQAGARARVMAADALSPPKGPACDLIFLDPPYRQGLVAPTVAALAKAGRIAPGALIIAEIAADDPLPTESPLLEDRRHGAGRMVIWKN